MWMNRLGFMDSGSRRELLIGTEDAVAARALRRAVQMAGPAAGLEDRLEPEAGDRLEHLQEVVLAPDLCAHDVAGLDRVALIVDLDDRPAIADEPVLVAVVEVPVERLAGLDAERPGRGHVRPRRPLLALDARPDVPSAPGVEHRVSHASR